jgi:hypothetical protein
MKLSFLTIILLCFVCYSCKKSKVTTKQTDPVYIQFSADALAYVRLPLNKYFIYKDSASGLIDSVIVTESDVEKVFQPEYTVQVFNGTFNLPAYYYQDFSLLLTGYSGTSQKEWFYAVAQSTFPSFDNSKNSDNASLVLLEKNRTTDTPINYAFVYPLDTISSLVEKMSIISSILIEGKMYSNVEFYSNSNGIDSTNADYARSIYYWAKGVGIIKREIKTSNSIQTYLLVRNG